MPQRSPILRRYEVQVRYDTAFLYWNTNGVIAERWGHGPDFAAWSEGPAQVTLTTGPGDSKQTAIIGIRVSAVISQSPSTRRDASGLAVKVLGDCCRTFAARVKGVFVRQQWILPTTEPDRLNEAVLENFPDLRQLLPDAYTDTNPGMSFNGLRTHSGLEFRTSATFGIYRPDMAQSFFGYKDEIDESHALGAFIDLNISKDSGIDDAERRLTDFLRIADTEADAVLGSTLRRWQDRA